MTWKLPIAALASAASLCLVAGCSSSSSSGTSAPATGSTASSSSSTTVASIPSSDLVQPGKLTSCVDVPFEPLQYYKNGKTFTGLDIDLLTGIASRLGLTSNPVNTDYNTVVAALESGKCDLIVSDQYVTAARQKQVNMVAYWKSNETVIVPAGNPKHVTDEKHLCGLSVAGENGGLEIQILQGLSKTCQHNGQKPIDIQQYAKSPQALQALLSGHVQAWMASELTAETIQATGHVAMQILKPFPTPATVGGLVAMSFVKARPTVMNAVLKALAAMQSDGAYKSVFATYKMSALMVSPHLVNSTS